MSTPLVTYAQNREDMYLWALLGHRKKGFYVDVGAHHPEFHSVTKLFYDRGWRGINIEPNPELHKTFARTRRRDINLNLGVADKKGLLRFRNYPHHNGLSTFSEEIMKIHEGQDLPYEDSEVEVKPLSDLLAKQDIPPIDFMKVDVEGFEVEALNGNDWDKYRPSVLAVEATVRQKINPMLKKLGYKLEFFDGLNNYYLDTVEPESLTIYNYAPRVLGTGNYTSRELQLQKKIDELETQLAGKSQAYDQLETEYHKIRRRQVRTIAAAGKRRARGYASKIVKG